MADQEDFAPLVRETDPAEEAYQRELDLWSGECRRRAAVSAEAEPEAPFTQPMMACPACGREYEDFDGIGVVYCPPPEGCGFCRHVARTGGRCDACGHFETDRDDAPGGEE